MTTNVNIRSNEKVKLLDLIGEGEIEGFAEDPLKSIYLDDVPIVSNSGKLNINGINVDLRTGTAQQSSISGFSSAVNIDSIGQAVNKGWCEQGDTCPNPDEWALAPNAPEYVVIEPNTDSIIITLEFDGLYVSGREDLNGNDVTFAIEYQKYDSVLWEPIPFINLLRLTGSDLVDDLQTPAYVGETTTLDSYDDSNFGAEITIRWDRTILEDLGNNNFTYNGTYAKVAIFSRIQGEAWNEEPDEVLNITIDNAYSYIGNEFTNEVKETSNLVYYPSYLYRDARNIYEYKAKFLSSDDNGGTYDNERTSIIIYATTEKYIDNIETITIQGTATSTFKQDYKFNLSDCVDIEFPLTVKVTRITKDEEERLEDNDDDDTGLDRKGTFKWSSISKIVDEKFTYPNSALVGISFDSETYDKIPKRSYDMKLLKVKIPTNYDPIERTYDGFWNGCFKTEWTNNPAWCLYDLMTNERYGIGQYTIDTNEEDPCNRYPSVDKWALYEVSKFCDELVPTAYGTKGTEPRFTCNTYIAQQEEAFTLLRNLASIFRGMLYWMDNKLTTVYDHPTDTVDIVFSNSNIENGVFTYSGSAKSTRYNTVYVSWSDPNMRYENALEYVENTEDVADRGIVSTDLIALGCTSRGQAYRAGKWLLYAEQETVVFTTSIDNMRCKPGDLIEIYDKFRANVRFSGRVFRFENDGLIIDNELDLLENVEYTLRLVSSFSNVITLPDGSTEDTNTPKLIEFPINISNVRGTKVYIDTDINGDPFDIADYPESTIWTVLQDELQPQIFRVISVMENASDKYEINALHFNQTKLDFIEENIPLSIPTYRRVGYSINVGDIAINEALKVSGNTVINQITVSWDLKPNVNILEFIVEYRYGINNINEGTWLYLGKTKDSEILIDVAPQGYYQARISVVLTAGSIIPPVESDIRYMLGKSLPPRNINNFNYVEKKDGIRLTWDSVPDLDLSYYNIKNGNIGDDWDTITNYDYGEIDNNYYDVLSYEGDRFFIKAVDTSGNVSVLDSSVDIHIGAPRIENLVGSFTQFGYLLSWDAFRGSYPLDYTEIRQSGSTFETSETVVKTISNTFNITDFTSWASYTPKFFIRVYDTSGAYVEITHEEIIYKPEITNVNAVIDLETITISWEPIEKSFEIKYVEIRESSGSYETSIYLAKSSTDNITIIKPQTEVAVELFITPIDIAGNIGNYSQISIPNSWLADKGVEIYAVDLDNNMYIPEQYGPKPNTIYTHNYLYGPIHSPEYDDLANDQSNHTWQTHFTYYGYANMSEHLADNPSNGWYTTEFNYADGYTKGFNASFDVTFNNPKDSGFLMDLSIDYDLLDNNGDIYSELIDDSYIRVRYLFWTEEGALAYAIDGLPAVNDDRVAYLAYYGDVTWNPDTWEAYTHFYNGNTPDGVHNNWISSYSNANVANGKPYIYKTDTGIVSNFDPWQDGSGSFNSKIKMISMYAIYGSDPLDYYNSFTNGYFYYGFNSWETIGSATVFVESNGYNGDWQVFHQAAVVSNTASGSGIKNTTPVNITSASILRISGFFMAENGKEEVYKYIHIGTTVGSSNIKIIPIKRSYAYQQGIPSPFTFECTAYVPAGNYYISLINSTANETVYWGKIKCANPYTNLLASENYHFTTGITGWTGTGTGTYSVTWDSSGKRLKLSSTTDPGYAEARLTAPIYNKASVTTNSAKLDLYIVYNSEDVYDFDTKSVRIGSTPGASDLADMSLYYESVDGPNIDKYYYNNWSISIPAGYTGNVYLSLRTTVDTVSDTTYFDNIFIEEIEDGNPDNSQPIATRFLKINNMSLRIVNEEDIVLTI